VTANESSRTPTRDASFVETMQIGIVVRDLVAVATPSFEDMVASQTNRGKAPVLSGTFSGAKVAYLPTDEELGVIMEIFSGAPRTRTTGDASSLDVF
jgi:hypothetical protein